LILDAGLDAEIWGFSRAVRADVEALLELGLQASVIESPISDGKLAALGVSRATMLERIRTAISFATGEGIRVAFFGVDSTRADLTFVREVYESAVEAGAQEVVVVDTLGIATPEAAAFLVNEVVERLDYEVPVDWHGHDDFGLATAAAVAAVQAGATWVQGTVNGMGERAGNADLAEVALTLEALYGIPTRLDLAQARTLGALVQELAGTQLAPWKPVTGDNLFTRESGAVAAVRAGARWVHGTVNGMGERAGNANLAEVALALRALYGVESNLRLERVREVSERVRELSGYSLEPWKPVTGETLFRRESGAVASQFHDPPSIEPYSSELVRAERGIVLGKKSGLDSIRIKADELGLDLSEDAQRELLVRVKELGTSKRGLVTDDEFRKLAGA